MRIVLHWIPDSINKLGCFAFELERNDELTKTLLLQSNTLELLKTVFFSRAIDHGVLEKISIDAVMKDGRLNTTVILVGRFQLPRVAPLAVNKARIIIALVKKFQHRRKYFRFFLGKCNPLRVSVGDVSVEGSLEERRKAEDFLVSGKKPLLGTDNEGNYRRRKVADERSHLSK